MQLDDLFCFIFGLQAHKIYPIPLFMPQISPRRIPEQMSHQVNLS